MNRWKTNVAACVLSSVVWVTCADGLREKTADGTTVAFTESLTPESCRRIEFSLPSKSMGRDIRVVMVLPPAFEDSGNETFPFLYMLHGMDAPYDTWANMSPLRELLKDHPIVLVAFDGDPAGWYIDAPEKKDSQFETFFFNELSPFVEKAFRGNGKRAVTGFSMGGFGAVSYMLRRPDYFTSVSSLSGALRTRSDYTEKNLESCRPLLGSFDLDAPAYAVMDLNARFKELLRQGMLPPPLFIACGAEDFLLEVNRRFRDTLAGENKKIINRVTAGVADIKDATERKHTLRKRIVESQINYIYEEAPGGHNFVYWNTASERVGLFHWKHFQAGAK